MSDSDRDDQTNNPYDWIEAVSERLWQDSERAIKEGEAALISDHAGRRSMSGAVKL